MSDQKHVFGPELGGWVAQEEDNFIRLLVVEEVGRRLYKKSHQMPKTGGAKNEKKKKKTKSGR